MVNILGMIIAIDPGTVQSACVEWDGTKIHSARILTNHEVLRRLEYQIKEADLYIEMIGSYGMPVGKEIFETCVWIGRFYQEWKRAAFFKEPNLVYRRDIKLHHCGTVKAKDSNIRQALIDKYGPPGIKANPGVTYGLKKDLWAAFAIATYASETQLQKV